MSELRFEIITLPAAPLGPKNPLPALVNERELHALAAAPGLPDELLGNYGHIPNILPYTLQDGYSRQRQPTAFKVAVLENDFLRATFLLELGGRLRSLFHKPSGRELLYVNPVFQPANLALRNAWFSGGVEWNIGAIGHSPFTCSPLFAARVEGPDGCPILRLYEWERIRQTPFQIDIYLPDESPMLLVRVRISNPHDHDVPMYWWSNMAVPETAETRVIVPADSTYKFAYAGQLQILPVPQFEGTDMTYTTNGQSAADFFFRLPDDQRRWITGLDASGRGLIQVSSELLQGRKLFLWGMATGGRNWQRFLSQPDSAPYLEIQAGLAPTQLQYRRMPPRTEWAWLEGYGLMEADPSLAHGADWSQAVGDVASRLEILMPRAAFDAEFQRGAEFSNRPPLELIQRGSGWGALERIRREQAHEPPFCSPGLIFDDESLGEAQRPWLILLREGTFPENSPHPPTPDASLPGRTGEKLPQASDFDAPAAMAFMIQEEWRELLETSRNADTNWLAWLHRGVMDYYLDNRAQARLDWQQSLERRENPWARRNLATLALEDGELSQAADLILAAFRLLPSLLPLAIETGQTLLKAGRAQHWLDLLPALSDVQRQNGRIRLLEARAALALGDFERVAKILAEAPTVDTLREGELSLADLWYDFQESRLSRSEHLPVDDALRQRVRREFPLPEALNFLMASET